MSITERNTNTDKPACNRAGICELQMTNDKTIKNTYETSIRINFLTQGDVYMDVTYDR